jgi:hypothetical protein
MDGPQNLKFSGAATDSKEPQEEKFNVQEWLTRISKARQKEQSWRDRAKKCIRIYRDDNTVTSNAYPSPNSYDDNENTFNILWANTETLLPALFSAGPKPDVRNRYLNQDPIAQQAGQIIERCLSYSLDLYHFVPLMKSAIKDYLLTGRSVIRVRLIPEFETQTVPDLDEMGNPQSQSQEVHVGNEVRCELVPWDTFVVEPAKRWEDVTWIAFVHLLSEEEFMKYFPGKPLIEATRETDQYAVDSKYQVYEIWDKKKKMVYFIGQSDKPLSVMEDPLQLTNFWPIPMPIYSIQTNDTLVPIPEYTIYQSQAYELNQVSYRISDLVKSCKVIGVYDSMQTVLSDLLKGRDSQFFPVTPQVLREGGIKHILDMLDITPISRVLTQLYLERDQIKSVIYEVTGISDIVRGETRASETATAQQIKSQYAGLRLRDRRDNINRFVVEILRMKAELITTFFNNQQMEAMSGIAVTPQIESLLKSDILRSYKIDIETDSTIAGDMNQETQQRAQIVSSITQFIGMSAPLIQQGALPLETAKALLTFALQPAKISSELQDALELIGAQPQPPMVGAPQMGGSGIPLEAAMPRGSVPEGLPVVPQGAPI